MAAGTGIVGMAKRIASTIDPWPLAVPIGKHAIIFRAAGQRQLLGAPYRRRRQFLIHRRAELDMVVFEVLLRGPHLNINLAERRSPIA